MDTIQLTVRTRYADWPCQTPDDVCAIEVDLAAKYDSGEIGELAYGWEASLLGLRYASRANRESLV